MWFPGIVSVVPGVDKDMPRLTLGDGTFETGVEDIAGKEGDEVGLPLEPFALAVLLAHGNEAGCPSNGL